MDIVDYHIFINLLVNHIKNRFVYHRQFNFRSSQNSYFVHNFFPTQFFLSNNLTEYYSLKWKIIKQEQKIITKVIKKNYKKKRLQEYNRV